MDRETFLGGSFLAVLLRLVVLSIIVGIVLSALGITPYNILERLDILLRRIYEMGFGAVEWALQYLLLGAIVVVPIWLIARLIKTTGRSKGGEP